MRRVDYCSPKHADIQAEIEKLSTLPQPAKTNCYKYSEIVDLQDLCICLFLCPLTRTDSKVFRPYLYTNDAFLKHSFLSHFSFNCIF